MGVAYELVGGGKYDMRLTERRPVRFIGVITLTGLLVTGCSALIPSATGPSNIPPTNAPADTFQPTPLSTFGSSGATATGKCSGILEAIPMVVVQSGEATLAAAYEVSGQQLAAYFEKAWAQPGIGNSPSVWREQPTKMVSMCLFDGDFMTQTPGPPGDRSAVRVLVVIVDGDPQLWMIARTDRLSLPTTDPATIAQ